MATNALLDFILSLLRDDEARAAYCANPDGVLAAAGLGGMLARRTSRRWLRWSPSRGCSPAAAAR